MEVGSPAIEKNGWQFVQASVELEGDAFDPSYPLADSVDMSSADAQLADLLDQGVDAIWVRARLKFLFGVDSAPEHERIEKSLSFYSFVAVRNDREPDSTAIPFECCDYYGKTSLFFSPKEADADLKASVADAFWQLVTGGVGLADFEDKAYHLGVGIWMYYGCKNGEVFYSEDDDYPADDDDNAG